MNRAFHFTVGLRHAAACVGVVGAADLADFAGLFIFGYTRALDDVSGAETDFGARRKPVELLGRILAKIILLDIELAAKGDFPRARRRDLRGC